MCCAALHIWHIIVCMDAWMCPCVRVCIEVCIQICIHVYASMYTHIYMYACTSMYLQVFRAC